MGALVVVDLADPSALARVLRAALARAVAHVPMPESQRGLGSYTLQLRAPGTGGICVAAEPAGKRSAEGVPLRLRPLDPSHVPEIQAIIDAHGTAVSPMSTSASAIFDSVPPLPPANGAGDFDPENAIISQAPPPPTDEESTDEALTMPHMVAATAAFDFGEPAHEAPSTRSERRPEWTKTDPTVGPLLDERSQAEEPDPSISVDVTLESHVARGALPAEGEAARHAADGEGISVVFGNEPTIPGSGRGAAVGVVVANEARDDTVTSTIPFRRSPSRGPDAMPATIDAPSTGPGPVPSRRSPRSPRSQALVNVGRVIAGKYRIDSLLGRGAVGAVYRAAHADLGRSVAIKVLHPHCRSDPQLLAAFRAEARAASLLDHQSVTIVHDFGEEPDGLVYIVMEHIPGTTLQAVLDREQRIAPKRAIGIMLQVAAALSAAHERGIVHRDVKPDNIMLVMTRDDEGYPFELVKVCDFGIAALEAGLDPTDGEFTAGTPEYMAPEQALGRSDPRTDVYACGAVLYEMLIGAPPFTGGTPQEILAKHASEAPRRLIPHVDVDARLEAVVLRALEKEPDRRFNSAREMRQALKRLQS